MSETCYFLYIIDATQMCLDEIQFQNEIQFQTEYNINSLYGIQKYLHEPGVFKNV